MKYNERFIYIMRDFDDEVANAVIRQLFELDNKNKRDIIIFINSDGGNVGSLFAIYDAIKMVKSQVATVCLGRAYSSAACLLIAGAKGKRFITPTSDIMFHEIESKVRGNLTHLQDELSSITHYNNMLQKIMATNLKSPVRRVLKKGRDAYYDANQALEMGAVDHIIESMDELIEHTEIKTCG